MSHANDCKLAEELEAELDSLLARTPAEEERPEPDKVLITSNTYPGVVARKLDIDSDKVFFTVIDRLCKAACVVPSSGFPGHPRHAIGALFDAAKFLDDNAEHPLIRRMATLAPKMPPEEELELWRELGEAFPHDDLPKRHEESEMY
jgi:hypothetical protein